MNNVPISNDNLASVCLLSGWRAKTCYVHSRVASLITCVESKIIQCFILLIASPPLSITVTNVLHSAPYVMSCLLKSSR